MKHAQVKETTVEKNETNKPFNLSILNNSRDFSLSRLRDKKTN